MRDMMVKILLRQLLPAAAGALGARLLTAYPSVYATFCAAKF